MACQERLVSAGKRTAVPTITAEAHALGIQALVPTILVKFVGFGYVSAQHTALMNRPSDHTHAKKDGGYPAIPGARSGGCRTCACCPPCPSSISSFFVGGNRHWTPPESSHFNVIAVPWPIFCTQGGYQGGTRLLASDGNRTRDLQSSKLLL